MIRTRDFDVRPVAAKAGFVGLLSAAGVALFAHAAAAQQVGTAAAVNPSAQARGSGGARTIVIGQSIAHRERIQTTSAGSVQLLFLDKTSMTIGPNSDLAIDEYVYNPSSNTGKLAATLTKGVMRFVGGQISHAGNARVTTPNAVVGIRGGVGIFSPSSVYIGYGEGHVTSGPSSVMLTAGEYTQTLGGGAPPTNPSPPPSGFLQAMLALLQSQGGQGGGARATSAQVNQARTTASGTPAGAIATNLQRAASQIVNGTTQANVASSINQTIQTTASQTRAEITERENRPPPPPPPPPSPPPPQEIPNQNSEPRSLLAFTGGLVASRNNYGPLGPILAALGVGVLETNAQGQTEQAAFGAVRAGEITSGSNNNRISANSSSDEYQSGTYVFGPNTANIDVNDLATGANVLLPATSSSGAPVATVNSQAVTQFSGGVVEFKPGTPLSQAASQTVGVAFCQCEYTKWGLWAAGTTRAGEGGSGGQIKDTAEMFWVAGRLPANASDIPSTGSATYSGHAIANIHDGSSNYVAAGQFQNTVDFAARTGNVSVTNLDGANYAGQIVFPSGSPAFAGGLSAANGNRSMDVVGSFFQGRTSPVGEMGGALRIYGPSNYGGAGIFAGRMQ
ncbi:FecR domain-containing protein [Bradyrhizobium sp. LHD-71]|uniref:FecR domain-containing protein n=1 Tax=Bradyrhizobium sp. LHD-71 TaxID=3072141 RepID=UPI00280DE247|nr:FecR domain-containing protein [Bradyrhizobium sp. LHD-71]MDQ8727940.1 FecR domain-containing protein [Bradyrhizobium sp. LHD-71]